MTQVMIRPLARGDREDWGALWEGYLTFYETERPQDLYDRYFERLLQNAPHEYRCLVAEQDGALVGLAHYVFHRHGWYDGDVCYLQDLYVTPETRGTGAGRALIEAVYTAADDEGAHQVYWTTQDHNQVARQLYDRIGRKTPFIKYERSL